MLRATESKEAHLAMFREEMIVTTIAIAANSCNAFIGSAGPVLRQNNRNSR